MTLKDQFTKKLKDEVLENETIREIYSEFPELDDKLAWNEFDVKEKLEKNPFIVEHFNLLYLKEKTIEDKLKNKLDELIGKKYDHYRFESDRELLRQEIERYYLPKDETVIKIREAIRKQETRTEVFKAIYKAFDKQQWAIRCWLDAEKQL